MPNHFTEREKDDSGVFDPRPTRKWVDFTEREKRTWELCDERVKYFHDLEDSATRRGNSTMARFYKQIGRQIYDIQRELWRP